MKNYIFNEKFNILPVYTTKNVLISDIFCLINILRFTILAKIKLKHYFFNEQKTFLSIFVTFWKFD